MSTTEPPTGREAHRTERVEPGAKARARVVISGVAVLIAAPSIALWAAAHFNTTATAKPLAHRMATRAAGLRDTPARGVRYETADGLRYEAYRRPGPTLPAVPAGRLKRFRVDVVMHETKVAHDAPPLRVWSFGVDGRFMRGTGVSPPMVVNEGDRVEVTFVNGANASMGVDMPHSFDVHAAEVAPDRAFKTIAAGATLRYGFVPRNPGVYMYHCATEPMVMHLGSGMAGMFLVKPRKLPRVDRELWLVQQEYYLGHRPGADSDYGKMTEERQMSSPSTDTPTSTPSTRSWSTRASE